MRLMRKSSAFYLALVVTIATASTVTAQTPPTTPVPEPTMVVGGAPKDVLRAGTSIPLRTLDELGSKQSTVGQRFNLEVAGDVKVNGHLVFPTGTRAVGEVTKVVGKGMFGKSGKVFTRLLFIRAGDREVRITGQVGDAGKGGTLGTIGAMAVVPIAGFFVTGTSALISPGTPATGYIESDLPLQFTGSDSSSAAAPLVISTAPPQ